MSDMLFNNCYVSAAQLGCRRTRWRSTATTRPSSTPPSTARLFCQVSVLVRGRMYACTCMHPSMRPRVYVRAYIHVCVRARVPVCVWVSVCVCGHVHVHACGWAGRWAGERAGGCGRARRQACMPPGLEARMHVYTHACMHVYTHPCTFLDTRPCTRLYKCTGIEARTPVASRSALVVEDLIPLDCHSSSTATPFRPMKSLQSSRGQVRTIVYNC